jgi:hypothetical protein
LNSESALCPWSDWSPATIAFCEERLCSFVVEPANTWSNIGYLLIGIYLLRISSRQNRLWTIGITSCLVGIGSSLFHCTATFAGEFIDVSAMYFISAQMIVFNLYRWRRLTLATAWTVYLFLVIGSSAALLTWRPMGIAIFVGHIVALGVLELSLIYFEKGQGYQRKDLRRIIFFFAIAFFAWVLDRRKILCDPHNHFFNGHAAWHLLNSFCLYYFWAYHRQFIGATPISSRSGDGTRD